MEKAPVTSSEIGFLWTQYMQNSMSVQMLSYFQQTATDPDIKALVTFALRLAENVTQAIGEFFKKEKMVVPIGFGPADVNLDAPKLYSDQFMLHFLENVGKAGLVGYGVSIAVSARSDLRTFFGKCLNETLNLFNRTVDLGLSRGTFVRAPVLEKPTEVEFIEAKTYFSSGMNPFHKRALNMLEVCHLFENSKNNSLGELICTSFAQTTTSDEVKEYMIRGRDISRKHVKVFEKLLMDSAIKAPMSWDMEVTSSTTRVFSDKLMVFLMSVLSASGQGNYSTASTGSMRYDVVFTYQRLSTEIALFAEDGVDLMVKHKWMEEPPQAPDRRELFNS